MTLLEVLVTTTIFVISGSLGLPALLNYMQRARLEGAVRETVALMQGSRLEAVTRGAPTVVALDEATGELVAFADVDGPGSEDPPDGLFNPVSGDRFRETDYEIGRYRLPAALRFEDPEGNSDGDSIDGFANPVPLPAKIAVFKIDGGVADDGAFRIADLRGNFLEARVAAKTTARIEIRKWDGYEWREPGEGGSAWTWR